jgi:hypothetical protein
MIHTPANIVANWLIRTELTRPAGTSLDWGTYTNFLPDDKWTGSKNTVSIMDQTGRLSGRKHSSGAFNRHPGLQFFVKSEEETLGYNKVLDIWDASTQNLRRITIVVEEIAYKIHSLTMTSDIVTISTPSEMRFRLWSMNSVCSIVQL